MLFKGVLNVKSTKKYPLLNIPGSAQGSHWISSIGLNYALQILHTKILMQTQHVHSGHSDISASERLDATEKWWPLLNETGILRNSWVTKEDEAIHGSCCPVTPVLHFTCIDESLDWQGETLRWGLNTALHDFINMDVCVFCSDHGCVRWFPLRYLVVVGLSGVNGLGLFRCWCVVVYCSVVMLCALLPPPLLKVLRSLNGYVCFHALIAGVNKGSSVVAQCMGRGTAHNC